ncbi:TPA: class I SAM-dependent methyltransferase [Vibrio parahaemolyticus]|nr:class I SAM-dependent methyltransferase [Vibrio parahaemolyticus]HCG5594795.1 class I SAM-dependent methyltransferase [Vibrio parahaemolyticus]HCG6497945.1 class I SAM-dependent methyltransferase [Vibrio parahaemolyticus]
MEIYKNLIYVQTPEGSQYPLSEELTVDKKTYYRYMDKIYIPELPAKLSKEDVSALSEIRIKLNGEVIDYSYTKELISTLIGKIGHNSTENIIDFGCGGGILAEVLIEGEYLSRVKNVIGLDISSFAVKSASRKYELLENVSHEAFLFDGTDDLKIENNSIDAIISSFVMHFPIYDNQLEELFRVLKPNGSFVYNDYIYHKSKAHYKDIINRLTKIGFVVDEETVSFTQPDTKTLKNHRIVRAQKPSTD